MSTNDSEYVTIFGIRDSGLARMHGRVLDEDDIGITIRYEAPNGADVVSLVPWSVIARVELHSRLKALKATEAGA